jgi:hypothetical protein
MGGKEIDELLWREKLRQKIFGIKEKYHPRLVANLSKEAHDRYLIRYSICKQIVPMVDDTKVSIKDISQFIEGKLRERQEKLRFIENTADFDLIKMAIEEWKGFADILGLY